MSEIKERILGAVTVMTDDDAMIIWDSIIKHFSNKSWKNIETVSPDEIDLEMVQNIENTPECTEFISSEQLKESLGL